MKKPRPVKKYSVRPLVPPYSMLGVSVPRLPPYMLIEPPGSSAPLRVWMSHDAGIAKPVLSGKGARDERKAADEAGVEDLAKSGNAIWDDDAIDAVLKVGVLIAHVQVAAGGRVERDAWCLQEDLVERRIRSLGRRLDVLVGKPIGIHTDLGQKVFARGIESFRVCCDGALSGRRGGFGLRLRRGLSLLGAGFALGVSLGGVTVISGSVGA